MVLRSRGGRLTSLECADRVGRGSLTCVIAAVPLLTNDFPSGDTCLSHASKWHWEKDTVPTPAVTAICAAGKQSRDISLWSSLLRPLPCLPPTTNLLRLPH